MSAVLRLPAGLALLALGAEALARGASRIAAVFGIPPPAMGLSALIFIPGLQARIGRLEGMLLFLVLAAFTASARRPNSCSARRIAR